MDLYGKQRTRIPPTLADVVIAVLVALCAAMIYGLLGCSGPSAEEVTAKHEQEAMDKKITFTMPLEYTAKVSQCSAKEGCRTRYYYPRGK